MSASKPEIRKFDRLGASDDEYAAITKLRNMFTAESTPDDPPNTVENLKNQMQHVPPVFEVHAWAAWDGETAVAWANIGIPHMDTNNHIAQIDIFVHPDYRRQGLAGEFLPAMLDLSETQGRTLILGNVYSTVTAGEKFAEALGATVGLSMRRNDLVVSEVDRELVQQWIDRAPERASGFEIVEFVGAYPEHELPKIAEMMLAINSMPTDSLEIEDFEYTPEQLKQFDDSMVAQGNNRWSLVVREKATGKYAGWTDINFNPSRPKLVDVGGTAVAKEYQNLGLGRWLKAAVLDKLMRERPDVERLRTGNAHSNAPMLKINDELGFKPALTINLVQAPIEKVKEYAAMHAPATENA